MAENGIGARSLRKEDARFLRGSGNYVDDINRPGQAYATFVRSPHAHARIEKIDTSRAAEASGVVGVFTRRRSGGRRRRRPDLRLDGHRQERREHESAAPTRPWPRAKSITWAIMWPS